MADASCRGAAVSGEVEPTRPPAKSRLDWRSGLGRCGEDGGCLAARWEEVCGSNGDLASCREGGGPPQLEGIIYKIPLSLNRDPNIFKWTSKIIK